MTLCSVRGGRCGGGIIGGGGYLGVTGGGVFFSKIEDINLYRFSCRGGGGGAFFSKIEDIHLYRFSFRVGGGGGVQ